MTDTIARVWVAKCAACNTYLDQWAFTEQEAEQYLHEHEDERRCGRWQRRRGQGHEPDWVHARVDEIEADLRERWAYVAELGAPPDGDNA